MWTALAPCRRRPVAAMLLLGAGLAAGGAARADEAAPAAAPANEERAAVHGQATYVEQETSGFRAPYAGPNSLPADEGRETFDATLYLGARLWSGAEAWLSAEVDQGFGLDNTLGLAGFPSGEAYKVGRKRPYLRLPRAFVRETVELGGERQALEPGAIQLGGSTSADRLVLTVGKFGVGDIFDTSQYAHDPRADFFNWTVIDAGSFDYAADAWGYTVGATAEWYHGDWTLRSGAFDLSNVPNSEHLEPAGHEFQLLLEAEHRHELGGRPGRIFVTGFESRGRMALLDAAVSQAAATGGPIDLASVRQYRSRTGVHLGLEQQLGADLGAFLRAGGAGGNVETYEFTDVDRSLSTGLSLKGARWRRGEDTLGLAAVVNEISAARRRFLDAGGLGILIGDGRLPHAGPERILETYYSAHLVGQSYLSLDYQYVANPAYNRDRGPVSVWAVRCHAQF